MSDPLDDLLRADARILDEDLRSLGSVDGMDALWVGAKAGVVTPTTVVYRRCLKRRSCEASARFSNFAPAQR